MLYGMPYPAYDPKSMCRPRSSPIVAISVAESDATARPSIADVPDVVRREDRAGRGARQGRRVRRPGRGRGWRRRGGGGVGGVAAVGRVARALRGSVPRDVLGAVRPAVAVGVGRRGFVPSFCSMRFESPSSSGFSRSSRMPSRSVSAARMRPGHGSKPFRSPSWSGSSRSSRMPSPSLSALRGFVPSDPLLAVRQPVVVRVLLAVREPVAVGVRAGRARQRLRLSRRSSGRPSPSGSVDAAEASAGRPASAARPGA